ncbi:MAG: hypothetical protein J6U54_10240 [Clostridiales bacterium]|nr:hypothetical protein [Clostridiales bacterium]
MTYEEKLEAVLMFHDKYKSLIDEAPEGSDLWAFGELDKAYDNVVKLGVWIRNAEWEDAKQRLTNAMLHIAERWSNETDIELTCFDGDELDSVPRDIELFAADPSDGEHWTVAGKPEEENKSGLCVDCVHCKVPKNMVLNHGWAGYCNTRNKWVSRVSGCTDKFENKEES